MFAPSSQHSNSPPALRGRLPSSHSHCIAVATYTSVRQGLLVVYILGMYVSTAPLISQMHASSQQFDKDGRVMNRHAVRRRAARLLPRVRRTWRRRDCGPNPSIMARRRILGPKCKRCDGKNCAARSTGRGVSDAHIHFDLPLPAHGGPLLRHPHLRHRRGRPVPARRGPQGARCGWMRSAHGRPLMSLRRRPRPVATGGWRAGTLIAGRWRAGVLAVAPEQRNARSRPSHWEGREAPNAHWEVLVLRSHGPRGAPASVAGGAQCGRAQACTG